MSTATRILNYDDYIFRSYRRGTEEVFVYGMYWKQGRISVREIAGHTPDGCWIVNGARFAAPSAIRRFDVRGRETVPAEVREFLVASQQHVKVAWWHVWGENLVDRGFDKKSLMPTLRELKVWLFDRRGARRDQLLVRIHTTHDLSAALKSEPVLKFLEMFPEVFRAEPL